MELRGTTICGVLRDGQCAIAGDGQVTMGEHTIFKATAVKVRRVCGGRAVIGFAGSVADAFSLSARFEEKMEQFGYNLERAAVELAQEWRRDQALRKLEAMMIVADKTGILVVSGTGEVIYPDDGICAIGSGGNYALSAARALMRNTQLSAHEIAEEALRVASSICVYTNDHITVEDV
ncbi:MAG TPA: ATP-dependent protease subunit HslV [Candidatus Aphodomonas merdavium]|nr:ATP-dependent protease subunit HslV [Candidatus Aphodomonas merdavium]